MPATHKYSPASGKGFGEHHAEEADRELPAEMRDLDMAPGTEVEQVATDETSGRPIVAWTDPTGNGRNTTVDPEFFGAYFVALAPEGN